MIVDRLAMLPKISGLLLVAITIFVALSVSGQGMKVIVLLIGGGASGFAMAIRLFFMQKNTDMILSENMKNVKEANRILRNNPFSPHGRWAGRPVGDRDIQVDLDIIDALKSAIGILICFVSAAFFLYDSTLTDFRWQISTIGSEFMKALLLQGVQVFLIALGFAGLFLNLLGFLKMAGEVK